MKTEIIPVNGYFLRQHFHTDFVYGRGSLNPTQYLPLFFARPNQFLIDHNFLDEVDYFLWLEKKLGDVTGIAYLKKRAEINRKLSRRPFENFILKTKKQGNITIATVDGPGIRQHIDCDAIWGWHDLVYNYVPPKTVCHEAKADPRDKQPNITHEITERAYMDTGLSYDQSHQYAIIAETDIRRRDGASYPSDADYHIAPKEFAQKMLTI